MIIDDQVDFAQALADLLEDEGYETHVCSIGGLALSQIARVEPDLLILDLLMPGVGGWEVLMALRMQPARAALPVILMTSGTTQGRQMFYRHLPHHTQLLPKPLEFNLLLHTIEMLLKPHPPPDSIEQ
jgi:CheY-like chemotaxis protein